MIRLCGRFWRNGRKGRLESNGDDALSNNHNNHIINHTNHLLLHHHHHRTITLHELVSIDDVLYMYINDAAKRIARPNYGGRRFGRRTSMLQ
jgi:hypothetical protein